MTSIEYNEIMEFLQLEDKDIYGNSYKFNNGKAIVTGNIPRNMIQELVLADSRFKDFLKQLSPKEGDKKYLTSFTLHTKEELLMFLLAIDDFSLKEKTGLVGNSIEQYDDILAEVVKKLMTKAKLDVSTISLIMSSEKLKKINLETLTRMGKRPLFKTKKSVYEQDYNHNIRRNIDNYDTSVNPYLLAENMFKKIPEILEKVIINIDCDDNHVVFEVISKDTGDSVRYEREKDLIIFQNVYRDHDDVEVSFAHKYSSAGEFIIVEKDGKNMDINLTTGRVTVNGFEDPDKDNKYKDEIYTSILTSNAYAINVTDENMLRNKTYRK